MPTLAAYAYRHRLGLPYIYPDPELGYTQNYMNMLWRRTEPRYAANPVLARALEVLFILHADHEQNCSTSTMRAGGSSTADPYSTAAAAIAALSGPLHGGANEEVLRMLAEIGSNENIPGFIAQVKEGKRKLMGFGYRVYKNYDPRARIIKRVADEAFAVTGRNPISPSNWSALPSPTSISSSASSTRTWTFTRGSSTRPWASNPSSSRCCSASRARWAGWRSGRRCCRTRSRRSRARARSTSAKNAAVSDASNRAASGTWRTRSSTGQAWRPAPPYRGGGKVDGGAGLPSMVSGSINSTRVPSGS